MAPEPAAPIEVPDKVFFRIGEVAELTGVKAYVLRFWEGEFPGLKPAKGRSGQRRYTRADIEQVLRIKELLWERKFTIAGAKEELRSARDLDRTTLAGQQALPIPPSPPPAPSPPAPAPVIELRTEITTVRVPDAAARIALAELRRDLLALKSVLGELGESL